MDFSFGLLGGLEKGILTFGIIMARLVPAFYLAPFLGGKMVPSVVKVGLSMVLAFVLYPVISSSLPLNYSYVFIISLFIKEIFIGLILGFVIAFNFYTLEIAGRLIDMMRGVNLAEVLVPQLQARTSIFANFYIQLGIVLFILIGGHQVFIRIFASSFELLPPFSFPKVSPGSFLQGMIVISSRLILTGFIISLPAIAAIWLSELVLGLINRAAPQIEVFFLGMPLRVCLGIIIVLLILPLIISVIKGLFTEGLSNLERIIDFLK
jgi:flagellar biosynthetic protein FliR